MKENLERKVEYLEMDLREAKLEKEKFQNKLQKEFKLTKQLLEEIQTSENPDPDTMKAIAKKVLRILERNDI